MSVPQADLAQCADEPIRVPGAIQPHGWLVVLSADGTRLLAYSTNWKSVEAARAAVKAAAIDPASLRDGEAPAGLGRLQLEGRRVHASAHRLGEKLFVEFEPDESDTGTQSPLYSLARSFPPAMQRVSGIAELAQVAADEMKRLTGFGRCLVYRFGDEGHGEVLAERIDPGYESYAGHHFPGADVPAQARALYRLNHIRLIPDANYVPVDLACFDPGLRPRDIDLSMVALRSVSPVHLEYMRNMGTLASMSVSIVVRGELWGLISCHHHEPRHLAFAERAACEHLGRLLSMQVGALEDTADVARRLELRRLTLEIVSHLSDSDASLKQMVREPAPLLRIADATGAAVMLNDEVWTVGEVPPAEQLQAIANWVVKQGGPVVHTDQLQKDCPGCDAGAGATGVLALSISQFHRHLVIWFRPEFVRTVRWAGDPTKQPRASDGRIHPRRSFDSWMQRVRGRSAPWQAAQLAAATDLRQALIGVVLRRAEELAEVATELGRVNKELEAFSYTVSHDLRAPMRHIAGYVDLVMDAEGKAMGERSQRYLAHVKEAAAFAGHLVDALLDFSRMGRASLKRSKIDTEGLVDELVAECARQESGRTIAWTIDKPLPALWGDPFLLQIVLRNLLANACKYTRQQSSPAIRISSVRRPEGVGVEIADNGVGFQMKYVHKLFGVFQRLHQADEYEGTGIGLASVRRIVERHGGSVWAQGEPGQGATFGFVLPEAPVGKED
ncbi:ATP-binding protein [Ramlibacter sp.]|uniref:ATP-binding protein n=1 Tax=Ramlibacter sp. TaxID=1917967 RepID=UPI003D13DDD6